MFLAEWRLVRGRQPLRTIAIVDDAPEEQYLYPDFLLFERLFEARGVSGFIADPTQLDWRDGALSYSGERIDLVYTASPISISRNRGTLHCVMRTSRDSRSSRRIRMHIALANKRNLALLTAPALLQSWGVPAQTIDRFERGFQ